MSLLGFNDNTDGKTPLTLASVMDRIRKQLAAVATRCDEKTARVAILSTADAAGRPSSRPVFIEAVEPEGLVIFVNEHSGKAIQMSQNPAVALSFHWPTIDAQINIEGIAVLYKATHADDLWRKRDRESQITAWAAQQGAPEEDPGALAERRIDQRQRFGFEQVPRPQEWQAILITPHRADFWSGGWKRSALHESFVHNDSDRWTQQSIQP